MKIKVLVEKEVDIKTLHIEISTYWEDSRVNGNYETEEGGLMPCREGELWKPIVNIETGQITNWKQGVTANVNYKVRDAGKYSLKDAEGKTVKEVSGYVPETMHPKANGYGDYIRMDINENGFIAKWKPIINEFFD